MSDTYGTPERRLWAGVILQTLNDADFAIQKLKISQRSWDYTPVGMKNVLDGLKFVNDFEKIEFEIKSEGFAEICRMVDFDISHVKTSFYKKKRGLDFSLSSNIVWLAKKIEQKMITGDRPDFENVFLDFIATLDEKEIEMPQLLAN